MQLPQGGLGDFNPSQALEEAGVGLGSGLHDLSTDYTPYLHNKEQQRNTWAPPGIHQCPYCCPLKAMASAAVKTRCFSCIHAIKACAVAREVIYYSWAGLVINFRKNIRRAKG